MDAERGQEDPGASPVEILRDFLHEIADRYARDCSGSRSSGEAPIRVPDPIKQVLLEANSLIKARLLPSSMVGEPPSINII